MAPRKDIHRPSAIEPADYEFVAFDYLPSSPGDIGAAMFLMEERKRKAAHMAKSGGFYSSHEHGGNCYICGAHCVYSASFYHPKSNRYIKCGLDCAEKLECEGIDAFRKKVRSALEANAGKKKAKAVLEKVGAGAAWAIHEADIAKRAAYAAECKAWREANPEPEYESSNGGYGINEVGAPKYVEPSKDEMIVLDMVSRLIKYGDISEKAVGFLRVLLDRIERAPEIAAEKAAAKAAERANSKPVPVVDGRVAVRGEVVSLKWQESHFGNVLKMLVKSDEGFKLWGSVPSAVADEVAKGDRIEFSASIKRSDDDEFFGFFSRPSKAKVIKAEEVA